MPVLTTPHAARRLKVVQGCRRTAVLGTRQGLTLPQGGVQVRVTALPGRHAGHPVLPALLPPVMGGVPEFGPVDGPVRLRLYLSGDSLLYDGLDGITRRFPAAYLAVLPRGAP